MLVPIDKVYEDPIRVTETEIVDHTEDSKIQNEPQD